MPNDRSIEIGAGTERNLAGGTRIRLEGFGGTATHWVGELPGPHRYRGFRTPAEEDLTLEFRTALAELEIVEQESIHLDVAPAHRFRGGALPMVPSDDRAVIQAAPPPQPGTAQVVLYQDESGGISWHFPDGFNPAAGQPATRFRSAAGRATFTIPTRTAVAQAALHGAAAGPRFRGPITKWGRKIFKVFAIPALDLLAKEPVKWLAEKVEAKYRQELVRELTVDNYRTRVSTPFIDWQRLQGKRSLLVLHGIFSTTHGVLSQFPRDRMEELQALYEGRMIALDQLTVSRSPESNARTLLNALPPGGEFKFDILCHSRGGIVARTLAERGHLLAPNVKCSFENVFFVATPNSGSVLADPDHIVDMIDVFTNLLTSFPDGPVMYSIEILLGIVKLLASTSERHLPGLAAMSTTGYIPETLNAATDGSRARYAAAAADYEPDPQVENSFLTGRIGNAVIDRVFKKGADAVANDLVVPFEGVFAPNGHRSFPIVDTLKFSAADHVWHSGFFAQPRTHDALKKHFFPPQPKRFRGAQDEIIAPAAPSKAAPPPGGPKEMRRTPAIDFHEQVRAEQQYPLIVRLSDVSTETKALSFLLQPGETEARITVVLRAPGFDLGGSDRDEMIIKEPRDPATEHITFLVTPRSPGTEPARRELCAEFWHRNTCVGSVRHFTIVLPKGATTGPSDGAKKEFELIIRSTPRTPCDLCLTITGVDEPHAPPFLMSLYSDAPGATYRGKPLGKFTPDTPRQPLAEYVTEIYSGLFKSLPRSADEAAYKAWELQFNTTLDGLGGRLWKWLPEAFRNLYLDLYQSGAEIRSILISSYEMVVPWELIIPDKIIDGRPLPPLGRGHILGRWIPGLPMKPEPQRFRVGRFCIINPQYPPGKQELPSARKEAQELLELFPKASLIAPADFENVQREVLQRGDVHIFHFSGHGVYGEGNADLSTLQLLNGNELSALMMSGAPQFTAGAPLVYLNACHAGTSAPVVGHVGGFSANLLDGGSCGVLAPYWPVEDESAREFAIALYKKLLLDRSIGEALQELRQENPNNLTYRAFAFFGDPWTRLDLSGLT